MNFLGVGPAELIIILVVALVFVGPERLPKLAADIARTIREIRKYTGGLAAEFNDVIREFETDTESERGAWKEIETGISGATKSMTQAVKDLRADAAGARPDVSAAAPQPQLGDASVAVESTAWTEISTAPPEARANGSLEGMTSPVPAADEPR